jgi:hypothetical protein
VRAARAEPDQASSGKPRGRRTETDVKLDARIAQAWDTNQFKSFAELGKHFGIPEKEAKRAVDRHRKRKKP